MSSRSGEVLVEPTRRRISERQAGTIRRLTSSAAEELRQVGYAGLTIRGVASRCGVATATAYTYFSSKNHLITEIFWRRLCDLPEVPAEGVTAVERVVQALRDIASLVAQEPELAAACTTAMLADEPDVAHLRERIGLEWHRRLRAALGQGANREVLRALEISLGGALLHAGLGYYSYDEVACHLESAAHLIIPL